MKGLESYSEQEAQTFVLKLLRAFGEDSTRQGLVETPKRVVDSLRFLCSGYEQDPGAVLKVFDDGAESYDEMVFQCNIPFYSLCEHHMLPIFGQVHIGYIPNGKIVGLSKLARVVDVLARRLQVQERLTTQIADVLYSELRAQGVGVVVHARHLCMEMRGIQKPGTVTATSALRGTFKSEPEVRFEFLGMVPRLDTV